MSHHCLYDPHQSGYRPNHSTETVLLKMADQILTSLDKSEEVLLVLLDLSAAFDTVDHHILLDRLQECVGLQGQALKWFSSYLEERTFSVCVDSNTSSCVSLKYGVPQGSVLGPVLYTIYTIPLSDVMHDHLVPYELYADDNQLVDSFPSGHLVQGPDTVAKVENCVADVKKWLHMNKLALNAPKTEFMDIVSSRRSASVREITIDGVLIPSADSVRDLGVTFDKNMTMKDHIRNQCKAMYFALHKIGKIRKFLDQQSVERLVHAYVTSRLDMCNGLLYGLPYSTIAPLQRVQNSAARLVCCKRKSDHITPILKQLHWLPVKCRLEFKVLVTCYRALHGLAPQYISSLLQQRDGGRLTRSSCSRCLVVPRTKTMYGDRSFSVAAPTLWNRLPNNIRSAETLNGFKTKLKTHLFQQYFSI